jgi:hypothetical protein
MDLWSTTQSEVAKRETFKVVVNQERHDCPMLLKTLKNSRKRTQRSQRRGWQKDKKDRHAVSQEVTEGTEIGDHEWTRINTNYPLVTNFIVIAASLNLANHLRDICSIVTESLGVIVGFWPCAALRRPSRRSVWPHPQKSEKPSVEIGGCFCKPD